MRGRSAVLVVILLLLVGVATWFFLRDPSDRRDRRGDVVDPKPSSSASRAELQSLEARESKPERREADEASLLEAEPESNHPGAASEPAPEIVHGPTFSIHVRDRQSRLDLTSVEVRCVPRVMARAVWDVPIGGRPAVVVARGAPSPIELRGWRTAADDPDRVHGLEAVGFDDRFEFEGAYPNERGLRLYARAPGYAWGSIEVNPGSGGEREILLDPEVVLSIELSNRQHEAYRALGRELVVGIWKAEDTGYWGTVHLVQVSEDDSSTIELSGLKPGAYEVAAQLRETWYQSGTELARAPIDVEPGSHRVTLPLGPPPEPEVKALLSGTLTFPEFEGEQELLVRFHPESSAGGSGVQDPFVRLKDMERVGSTRTWRWSVGQVQAGPYQAKIWPLLESVFFEVPASGLTNLELRVSELASVYVEVVDAVTEEPVSVPRLFWSPRQNDPRMVNHMGASVEPTDGAFSFVATPGPIRLGPRLEDAEPRYAESYEPFELVPGPNALTLALRPFCGLKVLIYDGEALLPRSSQPYLDLQVRCRSGEGRVIVNAVQTQNLFELSEPGLYEVSFAELADEYRPWSAQSIEVQAGKTAQLDIRLERR